jgi:hypothetical protein
MMLANGSRDKSEDGAFPSEMQAPEKEKPAAAGFSWVSADTGLKRQSAYANTLSSASADQPPDGPL